MAQVRFAIPKGSLEEATFKLLREAWAKVKRKERSYDVYLDDPDILVKLMRPQEIPTLVAEGLYDVGITGRDWIQETVANVDEIADLEYGRIKVVTAFHNSLKFDSLNDLIADYASNNRTLRISSEYLTTSSSFIKQRRAYKDAFGDQDPLIITPWLRRGDNKAVQIHLSFGATEAKPPLDVDAIVDVTETGTTLTQNNLKIVDTIMHSSARLISNKETLNNPAKCEIMREITSLLQGAVQARKHLHIYFNVHRSNLGMVLEQLTSLKRPTISPLSDPNWYAVNTIIRKAEYHKLVPRLSRLAQGLVVHEPRQILDIEN
ncbi:MAG: ATP phosphoribosyltransferase [Cenarchaeum sp. SB0663_bin_5]|nr:ATP phosphoribosyltransferase [Cenarchaeum sp. SB0663_bin_5]MYH03509.1 ATP phosphoribosyltransferase [Cenarchaeum sp. SB0675_bin_21]MYL11670.1 ATP phosphoribosyltransferase [Cenarchaeum sp. SB0669_bin_11]